MAAGGAPRPESAIRLGVLLDGVGKEELEWTDDEVLDTIEYTANDVMRAPDDKPLVDFIRDDLFRLAADHTMQMAVDAGRKWSQVGMRLAMQMMLRGMEDIMDRNDAHAYNTLAYDIIRRSYAFAMHYFTYLNVTRVHDPHSSVGAGYELADSTILWAENIFRTGHADDADDDGGGRRRRGGAGPDTPAAIYVIRHLLSLLHGMGYARYRADVYEQVRITDPDSHKDVWTHAWRKVSSIQDFIFQRIDRVTAADVWARFYQNGAVMKTVQHSLEVMHDPSFPQLAPNRHMFAFRNGLLCVESLRFFAFGDEHNPVPPNEVACKFFDVDFPTDILAYEDPMDIPTPHMDHVLIYQIESEVRVELPRVPGETPAEYEARFVAARRGKVREIMSWMYAFDGRLLFPVNVHDRWGVILTFLGRSGTGKSTIVETLQQFYDKEDVRALGGEGDKFSIASLAKGHLWVCDELSKSLAIPQEQFQSMVTGGTVPTRGMGRDWETVQEWQIPGILAGNHMPSRWMDTEGQISRRMIVVNCSRLIHEADKDPMLKPKLLEEMPYLLYKAARMYWAKVEQFGACDLWGQYVVEEDEDLLEAGAKRGRREAPDDSEEEDCRGAGAERDPKRRREDSDEEEEAPRGAGAKRGRGGAEGRDQNPKRRRAAPGRGNGQRRQYVLPQWFREQNAVIKQYSNPLALFLGETADLTFDPDAHSKFVTFGEEVEIAKRQNLRLDVLQSCVGVTMSMPLRRFREVAETYIREHGDEAALKKVSWTQAGIRSVLEARGLFLFSPPRESGGTSYNGQVYTGQWVANVVETSVFLAASAHPGTGETGHDDDLDDEALLAASLGNE